MDLDLAPGDRIRRRELHARYGGSFQNGIASAPRSHCIFLFTGDAGHQYGYNYDGPQPDGSFHYTGDGQQGDQEFIRGNAAIRRGDRPLHLFRMVGGGMVEYLGEFTLDPDKPYYFAEAPDAGKPPALRSVIVFRLRPAGHRLAEPAKPPFDHPPRTGRWPVSQLVSLERRLVDSGLVQLSMDPVTFQRREAALIERYQASPGRKLQRNHVRIPGTAISMFTDLYDAERDELIEAKGSVARTQIRLALGQLLDYRRFVQPKFMAVLLSQRPDDDLIALLHEYGVTCIHEVSSGFTRLSPPEQ